MSEQQLEQVRDLLIANEIEEARTLLQSIDHPMADSWLERLNAKHPSRHRLALEDGEMPTDIRSRLGGDSLDSVMGETIDRVSGLEAVRRHLDAMNQQQRLVGALLLVAVFLVLMAFMQGFGFAFLLLLSGAMIVYLSKVEEVTSEDPVTDSFMRQYYLGEWVHYEIQTQPAYRLAYQGQLPPVLYNPPSVSALVINFLGSQDNSNARAVAILQSTLLAMWAWRLIEFEGVPVHHSLLGVQVWDTTHIVVVPGDGVTEFDVDGDLERTVLNFLSRWPNTHRSQMATWPWKTGPTLNELLRELKGKSSELGDRILQIAQTDAVGRGLAAHRGWRRRFEFEAEGVKSLQAEAHNLQVLMQFVARDYPEVMRMVTEAVASVIGGIDIKYTQQ